MKKRARVLVIDDDEALLQVVSQHLLAGDFEVATCSEPEGALQEVLTTAPDAVILDWMMPGLSGPEILDQLRQNPATRDLPILFLSARAELEERIQILRQGADDFVPKPFEPLELLVRLERLLARSESLRSSLQGSLDAYSFPEVIQLLERDRKRGVICVQTPRARGRIRVDQGAVVECRFGSLGGRNALLTLLTQKEGSFRFEHEAPDPSAPPPQEALHVQSLLIEAAWLEDEIAQRAELVPHGPARIRRAWEEPPPPPPGFEDLPFSAVWAALPEGGTIPWESLLAEPPVAPLSLTLCIALLRGAGAIAVESAASGKTQELRRLVGDVLARASQDGWTSPQIHVLLAAEPDLFDAVDALVAPHRTGSREQGRRGKGLRFGHRTSLDADEGTLVVHTQKLQSESTTEASAMAVISYACIAWIDQEVTEALETLGGKLRQRRNARARGIVFPRDPDNLTPAASFVERFPDWDLVPNPPRELEHLLRFLAEAPARAGV